MSILFQRPRLLWALMAGLCVLALTLALVSQHVFDMQPCPWCVLQRLIFLVIALECVVACFMSAANARRMLAFTVFIVSACGMAAALWQHFVAAASSSCNLTLADRIVSGLMLDTLLPDVFSPRASCADAAVNLLGVPYEFWSLGLFAVLAGLSLKLLLQKTAP